MAKEHEYCCCAIPLMNVGIYLTMVEQFTIPLLAGILSIATPKIVGAATPAIAPWIFAINCFVVCGVQGMGFIGVFKEKATLFQRYVTMNALSVIGVFATALSWIVLSASRHGTATESCVSTFFPTPTGADANSMSLASAGQGDTVCEIFTWVDIGIMGGLFVIMGIFQGYLMLICRWYSVSQRADHSKYYSVYSVTAPEGIPLGERQRDDTWDPRPSTDSWSGGGAPVRPGYNQYESDKSYGVGSEGYPDKQQQYGYHDEPPMPARKASGGYTDAYVGHPGNAYMNEAQPTPVYSNSNRGEASGPMAPPPGAMYPNEGQFGRKTPRQDSSGPPQRPVYNAQGSSNYAQSNAPSYHSQQPYYGQQ